MFALIVSILSVIGMIVCACIFPKIKIGKLHIDTYWIAPLVGALVILISGNLPLDKFADGLFSKSSINPIQILVLFLSMSFLSILLDEAGFFRYMASEAIKFSHGSQYKLFFALYIVISILTVFTSNDVIILTFTPFILFYTKHAKINPIPYLVSEFIAANTWSMMFLIGNPTNIYITSSLSIEFFPYFVKMILPTIGAGSISLLIMFLLFKKSLSEKISSSEGEKVEIVSKPLLISSLAILFITIILMAISNYLAIPMWLVSLCGAGLSLLLAFIFSIKNHKCLKLILESFIRLPYSVIPFILAMFTLVLSISNAGFTSSIAESLTNLEPTYTYGVLSFLSCNLINNIPMSVLFSDIIVSGGSYVDTARAAYASVIGSNLGAFLTPLGALAGIMWIDNIHHKGIKFGYKEFIKYGVIIAIPTILVAISILYFTVNF